MDPSARKKRGPQDDKIVVNSRFFFGVGKAARRAASRHLLPPYHTARLQKFCKIIEKKLASVENSRNLTLAN
jgi:hypothetical protein